MFPDPLRLPDYIGVERSKRYKQIIQASVIGIFIRLGIVLFEFMGFALFDSASIWMDAISTLFDITTTLILIICIKLAQQPPDDDHPFGHGRYEPLAGLQLGVLLLFVGFGTLIYHSVMAGNSNEHSVINSKAWMIPFVAMILLEISYHILMKVSRRVHSPALEADAMHYRADALTSLFATLALLGGSFFPQLSHHLDHIGAIFIALFMCVTGFRAARSNLNQLMDKVPEAKYFENVRRSVSNISGVLGTEKLHIQLYGPDAHIDIDIEVEPTLTVEEAHRISQQVRLEIQKDWPAVREVTVHIEPFYPNDHQVK